MKRILYIGGIGHNASTILDIMLGESDNVLSMGQVGALYEYLDNGQCVCGEKVLACPLWGKVLAQLDETERGQLQELGPLISKERKFARFVASSEFCKLYMTVHDKILQSVFRVSGADVLIDSSKNLSRAVALLRQSKYDVRFLHLIRDVRGYVNSVNKRQREYGKELKFIYPISQWVIKNSVAFTIVRAMAGNRYLCISFGELMLYPQKTIKRIAKFINADLSVTLSRIQQHQRFHKKHIFSGNRVSTDNSPMFEPSRIKANRWKGISN